MEEHDGIRFVIGGEETPWWLVLSGDAHKQVTAFRDEVWKRQIREVDPSADTDFEFMVDSWPPVVDGKLRAYDQYSAIPRGPRQRPTRRKYLGEHDPNRMTVQQFWEWKRRRGETASDEDVDDWDSDDSRPDMSTLTNIYHLRDQITASYQARTSGRERINPDG